MSSKKKVVLVLSAIALVGIIGLGIVISIYFANGSDFGSFVNIFDRRMVEVDEERELQLDGVTALAIECDAADITFVGADEAKVTLTGKMLGDTDADVLDVYTEDGVLHIVSEFEWQFFSINTGFDMTVYLPVDSMLDLDIHCTSGDMTIDEMQFGSMAIRKTSGDARITGCSAETMTMDSSSGSTDIMQCALDSLGIDSVSGDMNIADTTGEIGVRSTSGSIDITGAQAGVSIVSTSGDVSVDYTGTQVAPITIDVTSGRVRLYVDADASFDLKAKVTSGDIDTDMDITVSGPLSDKAASDVITGEAGDGGSLISITATSGDIGIYQK